MSIKSKLLFLGFSFFSISVRGLKLNHKLVLPKTINQEKYVNELKKLDNKLLLCTGPAGSGKTLFSCIQAMDELKNGSIEKIVLTKPLLSVDKEDIGFLPGNINAKMDIWVRPMLDIFSEYYSKNEIKKMLDNHIIEITPLAYLRGKTFKNSFLIIDEMQNSSPIQMKMILTRIGDNSRMVILGDITQTDINNHKSGLSDFLYKYDIYHKNNDPTGNNISIVTLEHDDVLRSKVAKHILNIYNYKVNKNSDSSMITQKDKQIYDKYLYDIL